MKIGDKVRLTRTWADSEVFDGPYMHPVLESYIGKIGVIVDDVHDMFGVFPGQWRVAFPHSPLVSNGFYGGEIGFFMPEKVLEKVI